MTFEKLVPIGAFAFLCSCAAVGPDFRMPDMPLTSRFAFAPNAALEQAAQDDWWKALNDATLDRLLERAMAQNLSLERARARIDSARALLGTVGINAQVSGAAEGETTISKVEGSSTRTDKSATFRPSFVIDLFGEQTRAVEAAQANVASEEFDSASVRLAVQLELVESYLSLRQNEALLAVERRSIANRAQVVETLQARVTAGDALLVDLRRAEAELASARARPPVLEGGRRLAALRIATLLAEPVQTVLPMLETSRQVPVPGADINPGVPAALLRNRPDIRRAEADFAEAVADVGVSEAQLYPSLRIDGSLRASSVGSAFIGPVLSIPVLDQPFRRARLASARARANETQTVWRQTVLGAVEEVQGALVRLEQADRQLARLGQAVALQSAAHQLAREAFDLGSITLSQVLDTEEDATGERLALVRAQADYARAWAQLNVAVGQGWDRPREMAQTPG